MAVDEAQLKQARDYALTGGGSGCVIRHGRLLAAWGSPTQRYDLKSTTKAAGVTALGLAVTEGKMKLGDKASKYHPSLDVVAARAKPPASPPSGPAGTARRCTRSAPATTASRFARWR